jgi:hypothetical protein
MNTPWILITAFAIAAAPILIEAQRRRVADEEAAASVVASDPSVPENMVIPGLNDWLGTLW